MGGKRMKKKLEKRKTKQKQLLSNQTVDDTTNLNDKTEEPGVPACLIPKIEEDQESATTGQRESNNVEEIEKCMKNISLGVMKEGASCTKDKAVGALSSPDSPGTEENYIGEPEGYVGVAQQQKGGDCGRSNYRFKDEGTGGFSCDAFDGEESGFCNPNSTPTGDESNDSASSASTLDHSVLLEMEKNCDDMIESRFPGLIDKCRRGKESEGTKLIVDMKLHGWSNQGSESDIDSSEEDSSSFGCHDFNMLGRIMNYSERQRPPGFNEEPFRGNNISGGFADYTAFMENASPETIAALADMCTNINIKQSNAPPEFNRNAKTESFNYDDVKYTTDPHADALVKMLDILCENVPLPHREDDKPIVNEMKDTPSKKPEEIRSITVGTEGGVRSFVNFNYFKQIFEDADMSQEERFKIGLAPPIKFAQPCSLQGCRKERAVYCNTCETLTHCSARHMKLDKKHEKTCSLYRIVEKPTFGKHLILTRDMKRGEIVITDNAISFVPQSPRMDYGKVSENYCYGCLAFCRDDDRSKPFTRKCGECGLSVCGSGEHLDQVSTENTKDSKGLYVPSHMQSSECIKKKRGDILVDESITGLVRLLYTIHHHGFYHKGTRESSLAIARMLRSVQTEPRTARFESKLKLVRKVFKIPDGSINDDEVQIMDLILKRFGRVCGVDTVELDVSSMEAKVFSKRFLKAIYPILGFVIHSCEPNSVPIIDEKYQAEVYLSKDVSKADKLSICYDTRVLFLPTWHRREFLRQEYNFSCKCKRCSVSSESETYFSGFPCSICRRSSATKKRGKVNTFVVPENPLQEWSDWICLSCKTRVTHPRVIYNIKCLEEDLESFVKRKDPIGLFKLMEVLVEGNYLHWNNHIIFKYCISFFTLLWDLMSKGNLDITRQYSAERGMQFIQAADTVIFITKTLMPVNYLGSYVLPLRLASIMKLREAANALSNGETTLKKLDEIMKDIHCRSIRQDRQLYTLPLLEPRGLVPAYNRNMEVLEMKGMIEFMHVLKAKRGLGDEYGRVLDKEAPHFYKMYKYKHRRYPDLAKTIYRRETDDTVYEECVFPWSVKV